MTAEVISLAEVRKSKEPHLAGEAVCGAGLHTWEAVAPIGVTIELECPACHTLRGAMKMPVYPPEGTQVYECKCGCSLFWLRGDGLQQCYQCGITHQIYY